MVFHKHIPNLPLSRYIDCIIYIEGNNKGVGFPKTTMSLAFNLLDNFKLYSNADFTEYMDYKKHWVAGLQTGPSYVESYGQSKMLVIQFKPAGASVFLKEPLHYFTDNYTTLDCVFNKEADEVWERLCEAGSIQEKIAIAEQFLLQRLLSSRVPNEKLMSSVEYLFRSNRKLSVFDICRVHNISRKHLNFLFKESLGVSPKMMTSLNRLQQILQQISQARPHTLTDLAYEMDYFDQAHFNNNFKRFTGLRPMEYLKNVAEKPSLRIIPHFVPVD